MLIESSSRYGGWMKSNSFIDETNGRKILFDYGPRTLRYAADNKELNTLSLVSIYVVVAFLQILNRLV